MTGNPAYSCDPDPPKKGQKCKFTYTGTLPGSSTNTWTPEGAGAATFDFKAPSGTIEITIPANATGISLHDPAGQAPDFSRVIS